MTESQVFFGGRISPVCGSIWALPITICGDCLGLVGGISRGVVADCHGKFPTDVLFALLLTSTSDQHDRAGR